MIRYITKADINDSLLSVSITDEDLQVGTDSVNELAHFLNVPITKIQSPLHPTIKKYAIYAACENCALNKQGVSIKNLRSGGDDAYSLKREIYERRLKNLRSLITANMLTGIDEEPDNFFSMELGRN